VAPDIIRQRKRDTICKIAFKQIQTPCSTEVFNSKEKREMDFSARKCLRKVESAVALLVFLVSGCFIQVSAQSQTSTPAAYKDSELAMHMSHSFQDLANRVSPSVVEVLVTGFGSTSDDNEQGGNALARERGVGSGVIVDSDGFIITNAML
jgi:S1-C subfamily serine protease